MEYKILKQLCTVTKGRTGIQKAIPGEYPLVVTSEERKCHNEYQFDANAVIVPLVSGTGHGHASIKRIHYQVGKFALGSILCAIIPRDEDEINSLFLYYYLNLVKEKELVGRMKGMANVTLPIKEIEKIPIPLLTIEEQLKFVDFYTNLKKDCDNITIELNHQIDLIGQLRQAFLREAMQGKLISNETFDGKTGADLLQEIQAEKEKLVKEKKIKKSKPLPPISEGEIPFEIPENWTWCRLNDICCKITDGFHHSVQKVKQGYPYISAMHIRENFIEWDNGIFVPEKDHKELYKKACPNRGDIIITNRGAGCGTPAIIEVDFEFSFQNAGLIGFIDELICSKYILYFIILQRKSIIDFFVNGGLQPMLSNVMLSKLEIPLPPIEIQHSIANKLDKLMSYCDDLVNLVKESQIYNEQLLQQVLREALEGKNKIENEKLPLVAEKSSIYSISKDIQKKCDNGDMAILAGYTIKKLSTQNSKDFGRVKLQKMLHLVEYHCQLSSELKYYKNVAGPHAWELEHLIEPKLESLRFFEIKKGKFGATSKVTYIPLSSSKELSPLFKREFKDQAESIDNLLDKFQDKNWEFCEMISTMYAVWNNRLIRKELFTDEILKQDFLAWDYKKKRFIDQLDYALDWIRKNKIEPKGFGEYIDKRELK
ncbi:restriction endonuclease subunit S [Sphingobacterium sp.]|uniref:restriction endonuclease subunit S n=1 Tax=Sphingobacterium sp. TaxID=341027 RepID=UPI002FD9762F